MTVEQFKAFIKTDSYIVAGSEIHRHMHETADNARKLTAEINGSYHTPDEIRKLFSELTGQPLDNDFGLFPPFYTDYGKNITVGKGVFINSGCCFQDQGGIEIGDHALIGHQVVIATINHDMEPDKRGNMRLAPVKIGKNVWIGAHATVLPGVIVGDGAVIAAGAVVTKNIPANTVAAGVPAKILKKTI